LKARSIGEGSRMLEDDGSGYNDDKIRTELMALFIDLDLDWDTDQVLALFKAELDVYSGSAPKGPGSKAVFDDVVRAELVTLFGALKKDADDLLALFDKQVRQAHDAKFSAQYGDTFDDFFDRLRSRALSTKETRKLSTAGLFADEKVKQDLVTLLSEMEWTQANLLTLFRTQLDIYTGAAPSAAGSGFVFDDVVRAEVVDMFQALEYDANDMLDLYDQRIMEAHAKKFEAMYGGSYDVFFDKLKNRTPLDAAGDASSAGRRKLMESEPRKLVEVANTLFENLKVKDAMVALFTDMEWTPENLLTLFRTELDVYTGANPNAAGSGELLDDKVRLDMLKLFGDLSWNADDLLDMFDTKVREAHAAKFEAHYGASYDEFFDKLKARDEESRVILLGSLVSGMDDDKVREDLTALFGALDANVDDLMDMMSKEVDAAHEAKFDSMFGSSFTDLFG